MNGSRFPKRLAAWFAMFAILLAALAPSVSHAVAAAKGDASWIEVCTSAGPALVKVADEQSPTPAPAQPVPGDQGVHLEHCPFCFTHAGAFGLPPATLTVLPAAGSAELLPTLFYRAPRPLFAWAAGQPRAPPASA